MRTLVFPAQQRARDTRRGSSVSDKQIAYAVRDGHPVQVRGVTGELFIHMAYVVGMDDYHWVLIDYDLSTHLVHKTVPCFTILGALSLDRDTHPNADTIRQRTAGFRESILRDHFHHQQPAKEPVQ